MIKEWLSGCGRVFLRMEEGQAHAAHHPGPCDDDVRTLSNDTDMGGQLDALDPVMCREVLREYGAWNETELQDHAQNLQRLLWLAAGDIVDGAGDG